MQRPDGWIRGPLPDAALALSWVPFAIAARLTEAAGGGSLRLLFGWVMFISFVHQPLTLPLVYASPWRLATHRRLFLCFPVVAVVIIAMAVQVSLTLVAVVGGIWNAEHILMQRYGITRLYGRKAGDDQGPLERWMLVSWFLIPLLWTAATGNLQHVLARISSGSVDAEAASVLAKMSTEAAIALTVVVLATACLTVKWSVGEHRLATGRKGGKLLYLVSTAGLFGLALVDPIAAVVGFVASHSIEYFVLVNRSVASERQHPGLLGRIARRPHGRRPAAARPLGLLRRLRGCRNGGFLPALPGVTGTGPAHGDPRHRSCSLLLRRVHLEAAEARGGRLPRGTPESGSDLGGDRLGPRGRAGAEMGPCAHCRW